jgi:excisionase family DNA binding protein
MATISEERRLLLTKREAAERLRISERTIDRWRQIGLIRAVQPLRGGAVRYRVEDVERLEEPEARPPLPVRPSELEWK